jgi:glycosyltransferase involved in cell wall biosynthesis
VRVLLVVHQFLPEFASGTEELTVETAKALQALGHEVEVFAGHPGQQSPGALSSYQFEGIPVTRYDYAHAPMGGNAVIMQLEYDNSWLAERFRELLLRFRPHIVHFFHLQRLSTAAIAVCEALGIPALLTATDFWVICPRVQLLLPDHSHCAGPSADSANCIRHMAIATQPAPVRWAARAVPEPLVRGLLKAAGARTGLLSVANMRALAARPAVMRERIARLALVLAPTPFMAAQLRAYGIPERLIRLQPFGVRVPAQRPRAIRGADTPLRIGFIGTVCDHKGTHVLVEAVRSLPAKLPLELAIYGDMQQFPAYSAPIRARAAGDARIAFRGTFARERFAEVIDGLDLLVIPSLWHENTPLVLLKAQAMGCPVVGSNVAGIAEALRHEVNGLLVEPNDAAALARALARLATDRELLARLAAQASAARSIQSYAEELGAIYHGLTATGEHPS